MLVARREDVQARPEVRERRAGVGARGRADGVRRRDARRRASLHASVFELPAAIAYETPELIELLTALSRAELTPPPRLMFATDAPDVVRGHPVDARDHARVRARALAVEHPDGVERDLLRDAVRRSAGRAGDVRPVAVAVVRPVPVADEVGAVADAAGELLVRRAHPGVDDVGVHARTGLVVGVGVVQRQVALVDPVEPPRGRGLRRECVHDLVPLDVGDARVPRDRGRPGGRHAHREALERMAVDEADPARVGRRELSRGRGDGRALHGVRLEDDDVRARGRAPGGAAFGCDCEPGKREAREQRGERSHCSLLGLTTRQVKARRGAMSSVTAVIALLPRLARAPNLRRACSRAWSSGGSPP